LSIVSRNRPPFGEDGEAIIFVGEVATVGFRLTDANGAVQSYAGRTFGLQVYLDGGANKINVNGALTSHADGDYIQCALTEDETDLLTAGTLYGWGFTEYTADGPIVVCGGVVRAAAGATAAQASGSPGAGIGGITLYTLRVDTGIVTVSYMGAPGAGVLPGGTDGQFLVKDGASDYSTEWVTLGITHVAGLSASLSTLTSADVSLTSRISTEEATRATADTSLTSRVSSEEVARTAGDTALTTRVSTEEVARAAGDTSLTTRVSTEETTRAAADTSLTTRLSTEETARASGDTSVTTRLSTEEVVRASADASLTTRVSTETVDRASADTSLTTRLSTEETTRASADTSLTTRLSTEEVTRSSAVSTVTVATTSLTTRVSTEEVARASADTSLATADTSLTTRLSTEETTRSSAVSTVTVATTSLTTRVSSEEATRGTADTSLQTRFSTADVSLTTRLSTEETTRGTADTSLTSRLSTEETARGSADTSLATAAAATYLPLAGGVMTGVLAFLAGTAALPGLAVAGDLNTGIYGVSTDVLGVSAGGVAVQTWGVGTSTLTGNLLRGADNTYDDGALGANRVRSYYAGTSFIAPLGAVGTPSYSFTGDANTGFWSPAADTWAASAGGVETIRGVSGLVTVATKLSISGVNLGSVALDVFTNTAGTIAALQSNALAANGTALSINLGNSITGSASSLFMQAAVSENWITQLYNSGAGGAKYHALVAGAATGDPYITFEINGGGAWSAGLDNSDSDAFLISQWSTLGTNNRLRIATDGVATLYNNLLLSADATYNIGAAAANRPNNIFAAGTITTGGDISKVSGSYTTSMLTAGFFATAPSGATAYLRLLQTAIVDFQISNIASTGVIALTGATNYEFRNGTTPQLIYAYNTWTAAGVDYERTQIGWSSNTFYIRTQAGGTGANRNMALVSAANLFLGGGGLTSWVTGSTGHWLPNVDATYDFGSSSNQIRDAYLSRYLRIGGVAPAGAANQAAIQAFGSFTSFIGGDVLTDATNKYAVIAGLHYSSATAPVTGLMIFSGVASNNVYIGGGTGIAATSVRIVTAATNSTATGTDRWIWNSSGHFLASSDNTYDIGASGANRPRSLFLGTNITVGGQILGASGTFMIFGSNGRIGATGNGTFVLYDDATTSFGRLQFGGATSSFPALKRSGTELQFRLADDSNWADVRALSYKMPNGQVLYGDGTAGFTFQDNAGTATILAVEAANTLAMRNGTNAQVLRVYNTWAAAGVDYERATLGWQGNALVIGTEVGGTGLVRNVRIQSSGTAGGQNVLISVAGTDRWAFTAGGNLNPQADNTYDIGASGANRVRNLYVGNAIYAPGLLLSNSSSSPRVNLYPVADGIMSIYNGAGSGFTGIKFGGLTASQPYLKVNGAGLETKVADDTAYAPHAMQYLDVTDGVTAPAAATGRARIYVDTADGDLKVIFADGTIKTLATDT
jgi:hypothetical protein